MIEFCKAQLAHGNSLFRLNRLFCSCLLLTGLIFNTLSAQSRYATYTILESDPQPGDAVTLVVAVGDTTDTIPANSILSVLIPYDASMLSPEGTATLGVENSFFVAAGSEYTWSVEVDEVNHELLLKIMLKQTETGSGYGEVARIKGLMVLEEALKFPGLGQTPLSKSMVAYPNPARNQVHVELPTDHRDELHLVDLQGRLCKQQLLSEGQNSASIDLNGLAPGHYIVLVPGNTRLHRLRIEVR